jgi:two-component system, chemotaxis family, CheB/CheR fusion protein
MLVDSGTLGVDLVDHQDSSDRAEPIRKVMRILQDETGVNFGGYKPGTVGRRISRRMALNHISDPTDYLVLVQTAQSERVDLFRDLLIGVTRFFRDRDVWFDLQENILRPMIADVESNATLRMWVAGCSTGEEAYTLAMLVNEEVHRQSRSLNVKIFATDIDKRAIEKASKGIFAESVVADVDADRLQRYFRRNGEAYEIIPEIRQTVMFAAHNLTRDPPFTKLDLVCCRNLLIYFDHALQEQAIQSFHFGLKTGGALLLGSSESVGDMGDRFPVIDAKHKLFRAIGAPPSPKWFGELPDAVTAPGFLRKLNSSERNRQLDNERNESVSSERIDRGDPAELDDVTRALQILTTRYVPAALLIDEDFRLVHVFGDAGEYLRLASGVPKFNTLDLVHPSIRRVLSTAIPSALSDGTSMVFQPLIAREGGDPFALRVLPCANVLAFQNQRLVLAVFEPVSQVLELDRLTIDERVGTYLDSVQKELHHIDSNKRELVEQLESFNEELQAANEELLAANEELQATNEELQATNEELQSVNEELHTVNAEYQQKVIQYESLSADLDHLLSSIDIGTLFLGADLAVRKFTPSVVDFIPLLDRDIGRKISDIATRIDDEDLVANIELVLESGQPIERTVESRSGPVLVRILPYRNRDAVGVLVTFTNVAEVKRTYDLARRVLDSLPAQVAFIDRDGTIRMVNREWERFGEMNSGSDGAEPQLLTSNVGSNYFQACEGDEDGQRMIDGFKLVLSGEAESFSMEYPCDTPTEKRWFLARCTATHDLSEAVVVHFDVTARRNIEAAWADLATQDYLTEVLNRRGFDQQLAIEHNRIKRTGVFGSALLIDCDDFKKVNDQLGHVGGDSVLITVSRRITQSLRPGDTLARVGGDEFAVLMPGVKIAEAEIVAERIRLAICSQPVAVSHVDIHLTVSIAVCVVDEKVHSIESLLEKTRFSLANSKDTGKNRISFSAISGQMSVELEGHRHDLGGLLSDDKALAVVWQPVVGMSDHRIVGYEFLTRAPNLPSVGPLTIFQRAQENGILNSFDERCLRLSLSGSLEFSVHLWKNINLYPSTLLRFSDQTLHELFGELDPNVYFIELSEQQILGDASELLPQIQRLRSYGVGIAIDDVGFGRTALESLIILEPEIVKIDRTYVNGVAQDRQRQSWLNRLVRAARSLNADLIAEGIENTEDAQVIRDLGIPYGQGFLYGRPESAVPDFV